MTLPRLVVAGLSGDSGKTLVSLGLILLARERGMAAAAFKKGPDYIDAAWLRWASGRPARNLDTYMMGFEGARRAFVRHALAGGLNVIEGNRGLYDGADAEGTHSTAALAKLLEAPVVLVVSPAKLTRTAAALVLGCQRLDPGVRLAGVVLNRVSSTRQERLIRQAIQDACGIPVVGVLPKAAPAALLPGRHLGLVTPEEHPGIGDLRANLLALVSGRLDLDAILSLAAAAPPAAFVADEPAPAAGGCGLRIGYFSDSAFTFYYPENLEALARAGATLIPFSSLSSSALPGDLDALYIGGGFPETHAAALSANRGLLGDLRAAAAGGLPVYAECGGLMVLSEAIAYRGRRYEMSGVLPFEVEVLAEPQGHGYAELLVDRPNPFFAQGLRLRGHEFHYSRIVLRGPAPATACAVERGTGCFAGRDGVIQGNVWAAYTHLHALATPEWAGAMLRAAGRRREARVSAGYNAKFGRGACGREGGENNIVSGSKILFGPAVRRRSDDGNDVMQMGPQPERQEDVFMSKLVPPHGSKDLKPLLLAGEQRQEELRKAERLRKVPMTSRETSDLIMMGIGAFTPLDGFMGRDDWQGVCDEFKMPSKNGLFWPIPITLSAEQDLADSISLGEEVALWDLETESIMGTMRVTEKYTIDKEHECKQVFRTTDTQHPGVQKVMAQGPVNLAGPVKVLSESYYPEMFPTIYQRPAEARKIFEERGWSTVAALQLRNPMHNSHAYLAWIAIEVCDGVYIHQLIGKLKPGDIPAEVRVRAIDALVNKYFRKERVVQGGYPMEMRYAGPREALLHAVFRQNYGCSHLIVGRDHAGVGDYYGPFDAQKIFNEIPQDALVLRPLNMDWTFYCYECGSMASMKTCPHESKAVIDENGNYKGGARLLLSGTMLRKLMSEGKPVPKEFSKPEVIAILKEYYDSLEEKVEVKLHGVATGEVNRR